MRRLMQKLLAARVRPYYIYQADMISGTDHLRTRVEAGLEIIKEGLRGWTSGLAVPHFVIDSPGGGGKIPILPNYVESISDKEVVLRNYEGQRHVYRQPSKQTDNRKPAPVEHPDPARTATGASPISMPAWAAMEF